MDSGYSESTTARAIHDMAVQMHALSLELAEFDPADIDPADVGLFERILRDLDRIESFIDAVEGK